MRTPEEKRRTEEEQIPGEEVTALELGGRAASARPSVGLTILLRQLDLRIRALAARSSHPVVVVLEAGHFDVRRGAEEFCLASMAVALEMCVQLIRRHNRHIRVVLSILVDDLALVCGGESCRASPNLATGTESSLPRDLEELVAASRFAKRKRLLVMSERNAKNRGIAWLRDAFSNDRLPASVRAYDAPDSTSFEFAIEGGSNVVLATARGDSWSGQCPLVMGQHYADLAVKVGLRFSSIYPQLIVDFSLASERGKVLSGAELAVKSLIPRLPDSGPRHIVTVFSDPRCLSHVVEDVCGDDFV